MSGWAAELIGDGPRCEFVDAVNRMVGDAREHVAQIGLRIDAVEFCGAHEAVDGSGALTPGICTGKQVIATAMQICALKTLCVAGNYVQSIFGQGRDANRRADGQRFSARRTAHNYRDSRNRSMSSGG